MRHYVKAWTSPFLSDDRKSLWMRAETEDGPPIDLEIPFDLAGQLVFAVALAGQQASIEANEDPNVVPDFSNETWDAIPVRGLGLSWGRTPAETALVVDLFRVRLAFSLDSKKVADLGASFAQTAATLSADPSKKI